MAKEKEFTAKGWKSNKVLRELIDNAPSHKEIAEYIKSPAFTEKDYIDVMAGMYKNLNPHYRYGGYGDRKEIKEALKSSPHSKLTNNDKAIDFMYDVLDLKRDWNKKNPNNEIDIRDHNDDINEVLKRGDISSKMIHKLISEPKYMLEHRHSENELTPPKAILNNEKIRPEHLYKYLTHHPSHVDDIVNHDKADSRLEGLIFDNPEHLKNLTNSNIEQYLSKHASYQSQSDGTNKRKLDISPKIAKTIVEHAHDKLYDDALLFKTLDVMDPEDKKSFIDRKLGIAGGKPAGLASWRTNDEQTNQASEGWADWTNGEEHDPKFAQRIARSPHLTDTQAEHIKRHGDFDSKYNLYHNKQVDPKHGVEMFKMWHDNEENKGYGSEQLQDAYQNKKDDVYTIDDIDQDLINEDDLLEGADEIARNNYDFGDWVSDNEDKILREMKLDDDDYEKIDEKLRDEYGDWTGENPKFNKELDDQHQKLIDYAEENDGVVHQDKIPEITGKPAKNLFISHLGDEHGNITPEEIEEYSKEENPEEIDFSNHDDFSINEHPEYDERYTEIADAHKSSKLNDNPYSVHDKWYEDYNDSDKYQEAHQEAMREAKEEAAREHYGELYTSSHQDDRFIPEHLHQHIPNIEDIKRNRKKDIGEPTDFLNKHIPERSYEHPYGEEQHLHEFLKDHSDANGGSIDIGRMHKLMPNQGETWKKIFGSKGKISSGEIQEKIDQIKKTPYAISYGKWDGNKMQNVNDRDQIVFRLDHSDESIKPLQEDPELYNTFKRVQEVSKRSGHPTKDNSIAWARVDTTDPDHWMIDEVQSDFGKTVTQYLKDNDREDKAGHVQKISDYHKNWREALINRVLNEAKKHGASKVSTHSPESKASHTGAGKAHSVYQDSYKKVPRKMGFKPSPAQTLPVTEKTREGVFNKQDTNPKELMESHTDAWNHHKSWANTYNELLGAWGEDPNANETRPALIDKTKKYMDYHTNLAEQHGARAKAYGQSHDNVSVFPIVPPEGSMLEEASKHMREDTNETHSADEKLKTPPVDFSKQNYHEGHTYNLKPNLVKNMLSFVTDLKKWEKLRNIFIGKSKKSQINITISLPDDETDLDKSEYYSPNKEGEEHPTKPYVAKMHPETGLSWHHNDELAQKNDSIINDPKQRQRLLQRMPTHNHKAGMEAIMNMVSKDPNRHFIPSRDGGREKMRARHIKSLMLSPESSKIDLDANNRLSISLPRHGTMGGSTTWNYQLTPNKVVKNEQGGIKKPEQGRDFEINEREQSRGNLRKHGRSSGSVKKTQYRADLGGSGDRSIRSNISGKHLQKLQLLMKGAARRLFPFNPDQSVDSHEEENISRWQHASPNENADEHQNLQDYREDIPHMEGAARVRALNKLSRRTQSRPSTKSDGKREFLLHRGMSEDEHQAAMSETGKHIMHGVRSSWTPSYDTANEFARNYNKGKNHKPVSAWIHEDKIASIPKQYGKVLMNPLGDEVGKVRGQNQYADEFETIVSPHHSELHEQSGKKHFSSRTSPSSLDEAISDRKGLDSYYVKQQIQSHRMKKTEDIKKGAMKRLAPFKPEYGSPEHEAVEEWTGFGDMNSSARDEIPAMPKNAKIRALHKLGKHTEVRRHPKTGERMFLLHRGMGGDEYNESHSYSNKLMNHSVYDKGTKTSWTPHVKRALNFARDHKSTDPSRVGKVVSAWVPESEIHHVPNQVLVPDENSQFRDEHEVIVNHQTPHPHASKDVVKKVRFPSIDLQTKISMKGHPEKQTTAAKHKDIVTREKRVKQYRDKVVATGKGKDENNN